MGCGVLYLIMPGSCRHRTQDTRVRDRSRADEDTPCNRPGVHAVTVGSSQAANLRIKVCKSKGIKDGLVCSFSREVVHRFGV
jgi:hypothetical protein